MNRPLQSYKPRGAAKCLFSTYDREVLLEGPARTGKSRGAMEWADFNLRRYPGSRALFLRKTKESMAQSILVDYEDSVLTAKELRISGEARRENRQSYFYQNGSEVVVGGLDKASKVMSSEYDMIVVFEATEISLDDWERLLTRLSNHMMPFQQIIADCNPGPPNHWLNGRAVKDTMVRIKSRLQDNPVMYIDEETPTPFGAQYIKHSMEPLTGVRRLRLFKGLWAASEGMVYEDFDPRVHCLDNISSIPHRRGIKKTFAAVDWGYRDPGVIQVWGLDDDYRMYLLHQVYMTERHLEDFWVPVAKRIKAKYKTSCFVCDSAEPEHIRLFNRYSLNAIKASKDILIGIRKVEDRLIVQPDGEPRIYFMKDSLERIDPKLRESANPKRTEDEFLCYVYRDPKDKRALDEKPMDYANHGMDTMRYAVIKADQMCIRPVDMTYQIVD